MSIFVKIIVFDPLICFSSNDPLYSSIEVLQRGYAIHDRIKKGSILFLGINPSFSGNPKSMSHFINIDENQKNHPYFNRFKDISLKTKLSWTHYDLYFFRETRQNFILKLLKDAVGSDFLFKQLAVSKKVILDAQPKIIVVSNALSRHFLGFDKNKEKNTGVWMDFDFVFDQEIGTYRITNTELKNVPVFFTSMLTDQRALDNGSYERLIWHIKFVLSKLNEN
ncbi:hypothetical protein SAMN05444671_3949 [Flavobacterium sp. CF108]|uniref:hypothetical protein n=1 Tax=unclassified Flavobacterium TaxID=196869 RepID=UPI0008C83FBA|nr:MULTISPECIES: hypothetical protein [unclassified Flavobacterium]SEO94117.1 hypothetical protein SAMN04487978_4023 [Flavobacterium sp. fv08]SHH83008.1 hypothetical protein SAMN05444671_3949 [Flavobacterium sp. CF108]